ncbi:MAG TPA: cyclic pyranopterin monophosphate synthase MoaC [Candidatus Thermoplasmatota archaeon]|nr:cyclic pyranopterin monophosphate synthase MoaC [Candidatus Thermoplasmatota archaeon]
MTADPFFEGRALAAAKAKRFAERDAPAKTPPAQEAARPIAMAEVGAKPHVRREATATGFLALSAASVQRIRAGAVDKGDPLAVARVAAVMAAKRTPDLVPLCHPIPLTGVDVDLAVEDAGLRATVTVRAEYRTGVEMEALVAVSAALLSAWDVMKPHEKDAKGQYPQTSIREIRVLEKRKGDAS